jgi:hypothetical protein
MRREGMNWINLVLSSIFGNTVDIVMESLVPLNAHQCLTEKPLDSQTDLYSFQLGNYFVS